MQRNTAMARAIPRVDGARLVSPADAPSAITVGTPAWYAWLERATSFAFVGVSGHFTARKERRRQGDGYWKAYRKRAGVLRSAYLGRSSELTLDRLNTAAASLAVQPGSTPAGLDQPDDVAATRTAQSAITPIQIPSHATQPPPAASPLLRTKLFPPPARSNTVARPRLIARMQAGLMGKLLLIAAPAGFGKTTLLVQGLAAWGVGIATSDDLQPPGRTSHAANVAWVSVDRTDNDPLRFWRYVSTALNTLQPGCGATDAAIAAALHIGERTVERTRQRFVQGNLAFALSERPRPGAKRKLDNKQEARLIATACSTPPEGQKRWTMQLLADELVSLALVDTISDETVRRTLKKTF
jgi:transposase